MKIKNILAVFIIVGGISYALYFSLVTDVLLKYGETIHTKAIIEERLTGKTSDPVLRKIKLISVLCQKHHVYMCLILLILYS